MQILLTDCLIIGAGPTGLGAAWRLDGVDQVDWLLVEAEGRPGGLARSVVDDHHFTWDLGGHVHYSHYACFDMAMNEAVNADSWFEHDRASYVWLSGCFVPYPFQLNVHRLPADACEACLQGLEARARDASEAPASFEDWMIQAFGPGITDIFMRPYNHKAWARSPKGMSCNWVADRVAPVDVHRIRQNAVLQRDDVSWGPNSLFRYPRRGGMGSVWHAVAARLEARRSRRILLRSRVVRLNAAAHEAILDSGVTVRYRRLVSTMPLDQLAGLVGVPKLIDAAARLEALSTHVVGIGLHGQTPERLKGKYWLYFPEANCPFHRLTQPSLFSPNNVADAHCQWSLQAEISEAGPPSTDAERVVERTIEGLLATGMIASRAEVHHTWYAYLPYGYPVPTLHRDRALNVLLPEFENLDIFSRGRFGAWKYEVSNQDHSFAQGVELVDSWISDIPERTLVVSRQLSSRDGNPSPPGAVAEA